MERVDLLALAGTVLTMDERRPVLEGGGVAVRDGRIVAVDGADALRSRFAPDTTLELPRGALLPGLVDAYAHAGHGMVRGLMGSDGAWPAGELYWHHTDGDWWYAEAKLAALERLRFGVTTGMSVIGATPARCDTPEPSDRNAEAYAEVGVRLVLGIGPPDPLFAHLSEPWSGSVFEGGRWLRRTFDYDDAVAVTLDVLRRWHGAHDGGTRVALAPPYLLGRHVPHRRYPHPVPTAADAAGIGERAEQMLELARGRGALVHTHMFRGSVRYAFEHLGADATRALLGPDVAIAHANGLEPDEVDVLGAAGCGIATVAHTHENLWYGVAPIRALLAAGANVAITTDGAAPYASLDLWREPSRAIWHAWSLVGSTGDLPPERALRMITIDAARTLGLGDEIGSLEVGKRADLVLVDLDRPHLLAAGSVPWLLCHYASGHDVDSVVVGGEVMVQGGRTLHHDPSEATAHAREAAERALARIDRARYLPQGDGVWRWPLDPEMEG